MSGRRIEWNRREEVPDQTVEVVPADAVACSAIKIPARPDDRRALGEASNERCRAVEPFDRQPHPSRPERPDACRRLRSRPRAGRPHQGHDRLLGMLGSPEHGLERLIAPADEHRPAARAASSGRPPGRPRDRVTAETPAATRRASGGRGCPGLVPTLALPQRAARRGSTSATRCRAAVSSSICNTTTARPDCSG